jgi:hypothetical protein
MVSMRMIGPRPGVGPRRVAAPGRRAMVVLPAAEAVRGPVPANGHR